MKNDFLEYLNNNSLRDRKILLAVSGGVDSMVMLNLFIQLKINVGIAHCNFQLRGEDSLGDEKLVLNQASEYGIKTHLIRFETKNYAEKNGLSIQMAARELRYNWFEQIRKEYNYDYIATAHHSDDIIETFFLNLLRKTGISGLHGIKSKSGNIIRPMLFANKQEIVEYANKHNILYRDDASNADDYYKRNYIRHHIIGEFQKLNPNFTKTLLESINIISRQEAVYKEHVNQTIQSLIMGEAGEIGETGEIGVEKIKKLYHPDIYLFELLHPFGFNYAQVNDVIQCLNTQEEKIFLSPSNKLLKTRDTLKIIPLEKSGKQGKSGKPGKQGKSDFSGFPDFPSFPDFPHSSGISMEIKENCSDFHFENNPVTAYFDLDKIMFPLQIRTWKNGDFFYPFGGKGKKKLSDLFSELKLDSIEKQKTKLLCNNNGDIIWIIGIRSDNRYKVKTSTRRVLILNIEMP